MIYGWACLCKEFPLALSLSKGERTCVEIDLRAQHNGALVVHRNEVEGKDCFVTFGSSQR